MTDENAEEAAGVIAADLEKGDHIIISRGIYRVDQIVDTRRLHLSNGSTFVVSPTQTIRRYRGIAE